MIKIEISNVKANGNSKIMNDAHFCGDGNAEVKVNQIEADENTSILEGLDIDTLMENVERQMEDMDKESSEYRSLCEIVKNSNSDKQSLGKMLIKHIGTFAGGVLQGIITECINRKI